MKANTIMEHEAVQPPSAESSIDFREHKVYKLHLEPTFFSNRNAGLEKLKAFLLSLPLGEQSTWTFEDAPQIEESSDIDTVRC